MRSVALAWFAAIAIIFLAGMLVVATGRAFFYGTGAGGAYLELWASRAIVLGLACAAGAIAAHAGAYLDPRRYYHRMWWRDWGLRIAALAAVSAFVLLVAGQLGYGLR